MDRLGFFKHGLGRVLETAQTMIGLKEAVNSFTEVVDEALSEIKSDMGLHLPTLDALMYENPDHTLREVAQMGFTAVEVGSYFSGKVHYKKPSEFRALADKLGLKITSAHLNHLYEAPEPKEGAEEGAEEKAIGVTKEATENVAEGKTEAVSESALTEEKAQTPDPNDEWWRDAIAVHKSLGCKYIAMQRLPEYADKKVAEQYAQYFNRIGELALEQGLKFQYHPTESALQPDSEGVSLFDIIAEKTDPKKVWFQIDTLEAVKAGIECNSLLEKHAERILTLHLHDYGSTCESGEIDFEKIVAKAVKLKIEELYIQVSNFSLPPMNCVERSINNVLTLPSVRY